MVQPTIGLSGIFNTVVASFGQLRKPPFTGGMLAAVYLGRYFDFLKYPRFSVRVHFVVAASSCTRCRGMEKDARTHSDSAAGREQRIQPWRYGKKCTMWLVSRLPASPRAAQYKDIRVRAENVAQMKKEENGTVQTEPAEEAGVPCPNPALQGRATQGRQPKLMLPATPRRCCLHRARHSRSPERLRPVDTGPERKLQARRKKGKRSACTNNSSGPSLTLRLGTDARADAEY
jgi:hypothetical protein